MKTTNRHLARITKVTLKDKTNWRKMLTNTISTIDLDEERDKLFAFVPEEARLSLIENNKEIPISFPVEQFLTKVKILNLDKAP